MINANIFAFVLALAACALAALLWITYERRTQELVSRLSQIESNSKRHDANIGVLSKRVSDALRAAPQTLAAEVADLRGAVERNRASLQRLQGRFDAARQHEGDVGAPTPTYNGLDPELAAELALQNAPSAAPGAR